MVATAGQGGTSPPVEEGGVVTEEGGAKQDSGGAPAGKVPVFLAQGHLGRTTISCDGGRTWIKNHSIDDTQRCFEGALDCDHSENAGRGIAYGGGWFVVTWGWGHPGTLQRSSDGVTWETVMTASPTFADLAFGNGTFVADASPTRVSTDARRGPRVVRCGFNINYRSIDFIDHDGGRFIVTGESGDTRAIAISKDGKTWQAATDRPAECGAYYRGIAYGAGTAVLASGQGHVCYSKDGGDTWKVVKLDTALGPAVIWADTEFMLYNGSKRFHSADGVTWQSDTIQPSNIQIGPAARSPGRHLRSGQRRLAGVVREAEVLPQHRRQDVGGASRRELRRKPPNLLHVVRLRRRRSRLPREVAFRGRSANILP